ncbi:hypothetical protein A2961_01895 [Candidatus Woesebacteria bacterium RIFCSPLOWO2_01_FULL_39_21]|uniref:Uncharacterized protein n=1 Tax=Candidatus Woesebacteria bacterium RIFCSPLOWO2_01_FULL_39_21 TaxID=1802519 RepID=A0A1F8BJN0_9BACT|nr:MAG: hypothetical protein A2691_01600 [Candidatus Woesebacteria bacterium RIFCSPHIGHO2_01_FULL_39_23]OGM63508.1 MAG: hypothetical protein A2961_01895 [Candidatus Woesebacteria bacterium RIFCSPLOWO2_01_FULL_39_21]
MSKLPKTFNEISQAIISLYSLVATISVYFILLPENFTKTLPVIIASFFVFSVSTIFNNLKKTKSLVKNYSYSTTLSLHLIYIVSPSIRNFIGLVTEYLGNSIIKMAGGIIISGAILFILFKTVFITFLSVLAKIPKSNTFIALILFIPTFIILLIFVLQEFNRLHILIDPDKKLFEVIGYFFAGSIPVYLFNKLFIPKIL